VRIYLAGGWGYGNKGDNAILACMLRTFESRFPGFELTLTSYSAHEVRAQHGLPSVRSLDSLLGTRLGRGVRGLSVALWRRFGAPWLLTPALRRHDRLIAGADAVVLGGGGYFNDKLPGMLLAIEVTLLMAERAGTPAVVYGQTLGPFDRTLDHRLRACLRSVAAIAHRDVQSEVAARLAGLPAGRIRLTADEANLTPPPAPSGAAPPRGGRILVGVMCQQFRRHVEPRGDTGSGLVDNADDYRDRLCDALTAVARADRRITYAFFPSTEWDAPFCREVFDRVVAELHDDSRFDACGHVDDFVRRCQGVDLMLSTNMHPIILAATAGKPSVALSYHFKMDDYMASIGLADWVHRIDNFDVPSLVETLREAIDRRAELGAIVAREHAATRRRALQNGELLAEVIAQRRESRVAASERRRPA
jgi:polysaccharide pyruvyl transferase WcaK-like protein